MIMEEKKHKKIYLDNCMFNRPFDDQNQIRIRLEAEAKLYIQEQIKNGQLTLVWSYILDFENQQNPYQERKDVISKWQTQAAIDIEETDTLLNKANLIVSMGLKSKDALHVASAIEGEADYFLTTDDSIIKKLTGFQEIIVMNPTEFVKVLDNYDN